MAAEPAIAEDPLLPPIPPAITTRSDCPVGFMKHKSACFKFASHSSYEMAKSGCESVGARLANIDSTFGKYIRDQVRTMGGNDFWIGSFVNKGRVYRQKGRTSCPIMRGQMINDALYGLVDCNSANRYICQKYGPKIDEHPGANQNPFGVSPGIVSTTTTTEKSEEAEDGGMSPVIYVVITVVILIIALIALKLVIGRYFRDKKKKKKTKDLPGSKTKNRKSVGTKGMVISPKCRKETDSKRTSIDSAVPPSNSSATLEKKSEKQSLDQVASEICRMSRPRVNGSQPSRQPPGMEEEIAYHQQQQRTMDEKTYSRGPISGRHRRRHSDPISECTDDYDYKRRSRRKRHSAHSYYSSTENDSDNSSSSRDRYGPKKVYQSQASRTQKRELQHYHVNSSQCGPQQRDHYSCDYDGKHRRHNRNRRRSNQGHVYHDDLQREAYGRYESGREARYGDSRMKCRVYGGRQDQMSTVSGRVQNQTFERQYFPEPHRLVSWTNMGELKDFSASTEPLVRNNTRSIPREPIRVSRQIYQPPQNSKRLKNSEKKDEKHIYESLDETARNKILKKASERNKNLKRREDRQMQRSSVSRASLRSISSIQSRRLPTPPPHV